MDLLVLAMLIAFGAFTLKSRDQRRRIALLGHMLGQYQIEKLMESLTDRYLSALGEADPERRTQIWNLLATTEAQLCEQFNRFSAEMASLDAAQTRVSKLPLALPYADRLFPGATFDLRQALAIHGKGLANAARNDRQQSPRDKAFLMSAELFLMQHTCHWFCRSRAVASARMLARHKTPHAQLVASVAPETRAAYLALVGG
jgi:hypothetical protein